MGDFLHQVQFIANAESGDRGPDDRLPASIGRYLVVRELARGTFGVVLLVLDPQLKCNRAVKVPTPKTLANPSARTRFLSDAQIAASIDHPNVIRVLDANERNGVCYFVMEYCPGGSFASWLEQRATDRPIQPSWAAFLVAQIAEGVQATHKAGIIHRDLKPGNVLLFRVGDLDDTDLPPFSPKVADFGLAEEMTVPDDSTPQASTGAIGTLPYMSPEQARGDAAAIGPRSDVYSLGAILYELLTREHVYPTGTRAEQLAQLLNADPPPSPRKIRSDLPRELEIICQSCLAKDPNVRYPTAAALAEDLRRYHRGDPVRGTPLPKRFAALVRRNKIRSTVIAAILFGVVFGGGFWRYQRRLEASIWIERLAATNLAGVPALLEEGNVKDSLVAARLSSLFDGPDGLPRLKAALALSGSRRDSAEYAYGKLLSSEPSDLRPIVKSLNGRMATIRERLEADAAAPQVGSTPQEREANDQRRANAAAALFVISRPAAGLAMLKASPQPQARTFLIHTLGPAGVSPLVILHHIDTENRDPTIRLALIQALGEVPAADWTAELKQQAIDEITDLYRDGTSSGVHGSAKWLLRSWGLAGTIKEIDEKLKGVERPGFQWRIGRSGLTYVRFNDKASGRVIEVSDSEVPKSLYLEYRPKFASSELDAFSPTSDCPVTSINFVLAAGFCNWLNNMDLPEGTVRPSNIYIIPENTALGFQPDLRIMNNGAFRLLTELEFQAACRTETETSRYYGDAMRFLQYYARYQNRSVSVSMPSASLKPNDIGLFDMLGNAWEVTQMANPNPDRPLLQAALCGGGFLHREPAMTWSQYQPTVETRRTAFIECAGFRVARTLASSPEANKAMDAANGQ